MKKNRFSIVGVCAALLVFAVVMGACSRKKDASSGGQAETGKPVEITVEIFDRGTDGGRTNPTDNNWTKWVQEKLLKDENIHVTFVAVPRSAETTTLNVMMAAGDAPDICYTYDRNLVTNYGAQGGVYDMAPQADALLPDLKEFLGPDPSLSGRELIYRYRLNGKMYYIPARRMNTAHENTFIRKDWLDKLGLPLPKTREEFYRTLVAFKENDPGGVGRNMVIPYASSNPAAAILSFLDPSVTAKDLWINNTFTAAEDRWPTLPGIKEGYRWFNKLFNEGLLDHDFPLRKGTDGDNLVKSGMVGAFDSNWDYPFRDTPGVYRDLAANVPGAEFVAVECFENARGVINHFMYDIEGIYFFIPAFAKEPEAAMRYVNWLARFENMNFLQIGPEGITHDLVDGIPQLKPAEGPWIQNSGQNLDYTISVNGLNLGSEEKNLQSLASGYAVRAELLNNAYRISKNNTWTVQTVPVELTLGGQYQQTLRDKFSTFYTLAVTGTPGDFDRTWDAGLADWLSSGGQAVIDERRTKYIEP
jgi:putative aldouronate transport system substrate-binding protein